MRLEKRHLTDVINAKQSVIGFWGMPPKRVLAQTALKYPNLPFFDLDIFFDAPSTRTLPDAFCHIIRNCVDNAVALGNLLKCVVAATGEEKCDAGRYAAILVKDISNAEVITTTNNNSATSAQPLLCEAKGPLKKRVVRIMEGIIEPLSEKERNLAFMTQSAPTHGFWGTPPHPIQVLDLFPDSTHIFGWTRCVELDRPSDLELEMTVPKNLPIVFFSQGFCAKAMLAKQLADKYNGMHVDVHDTLNAATMAKIEAFIRLSGASQC